MRLWFLAFCFLFTISCKTQKQQVVSNNNSAEVKTNQNKDSLIVGRVTFLLNANCVSVVVEKKDTNIDKKLILIPKDSLPMTLNKEGVFIKFNYRLLRMKNPDGCLQGLPADLTDVVKK